jgi:hypothetical protein
LRFIKIQYADFSFVDVDEYKKRFVKRMPNNEGSQGGFSQGVNLDLLEQNSIEIYKLLKNSNELLKKHLWLDEFLFLCWDGCSFRYDSCRIS